MFLIQLIIVVIAISALNREDSKTDASFVKRKSSCAILFMLFFSTLISLLTFDFFNILFCFITDIILVFYILTGKKSIDVTTNKSYTATTYNTDKKCPTCNSLNHFQRQYCYACGQVLSKESNTDNYSPFVIDPGEKLIGVRRLTKEDLVMPINNKFMLGLQDKPKEKEISDNFTDETHNHKESFDDLKDSILKDIYNNKYGSYIGYVVETSKKFIIIALCNDCIANEKWNITLNTQKHDYRPELNGTCYVEVESDKDMHDTFYIEVKIIQEDKDTIIKMTNKHSGQHPHEYIIFDSTGEHTNYGLL